MICVRSNPCPAPQEDAWITSYQRLVPHWHSVSLSHQHSTISISISRVNQFDAARLDIEMSAMLKEQLVKVFSLMKPGMLFQYQPELNAFLEFLIWRFSIWVDKPTPGIAFMNLRYRDERAVALRGKSKKWVVSTSGLVYSHSLLFADGVILRRGHWHGELGV
ncbi:hypothetical protein ES319_A10G087600v1 [Gossypium barbadense]|uniref:RING-type E3 ubiquitin transferase (cysteine targeting) n=4 Tax=Gossypium TaxID=3633 RepID=A0A5J5U140_GOSBA|nr:hypothetical protein ES319_A10G087600v1 [Gossypium barbadense]TYG98171.1 hypothetical protein ES288_A10G096000v1 [Gossypium darwinii]TYG98172.1 hypothetical protein ES288_A10G096000v1 [Gossypium darwinii]